MIRLRRRTVTAPTVPAVLPRLIIHQHANGEIFDVAVDGEPTADGSISRADLSRVIAEAAERLRVPVRVELQDSSGRVYADVIRPPAHNTDTLGPRQSEPSATPTIQVPGFLPGEPVYIATVSSRTPADAAGTLHVPTDHLTADTDSIIVIGSVSHTAHLAKLR